MGNLRNWGYYAPSISTCSVFVTHSQWKTSMSYVWIAVSEKTGKKPVSVALI